MSNIVPNKNSTKTPASSDTQVTESINTISAIDKTEDSNSFKDAKIFAINYLFTYLLYYYNTYTLVFQCDKLAKIVKDLTKIVFYIDFKTIWWYIYEVKIFFRGDYYASYIRFFHRPA